MRPDLEAMTRTELRAYVIAHPKDSEAFYFWADGAKPISPIYPAANTPEEIAEMERIMREKIEELDRKRAS
jgi:hypothetical protein